MPEDWWMDHVGVMGDVLMSPVSHSPARMADELIDLISQVREPYQARMVQWMESRQRRRFCDLRAELESLLSQMDEFNRVDQFLLLQQVACTAARVFQTDALGSNDIPVGLS